MNGRRCTLAAATALACAALFGATHAPAAEPVAGGTVRVGLDQAPLCLNPLQLTCTFGTGATIANAVLAGAFRIRPDFSYEPVLVSGVDVEEHPNAHRPFALTYRIRDEATWSDGTPVTAADFVYTYESVVDPANEPAARAGYELITEAAIVDAKTVTFVFARPYPAWRRLFDAVLPAHVLAGADFDTIWQTELADPATHAPIGSGPFLVTSFVPGDSLTLSRNPRWWGTAPNVDSVVFRFIFFGGTLADELRFGALDLVVTQPQFALLALRGVPGIAFDSSPGQLTEHIDVNLAAPDMPLLAEEWFRRALAYALDRDAATSESFAAVDPAYPTQQNLFYPHGHVDYEPSFDRYGYSPDAVADLMRRNGCARAPDGIWTCGGVRASVKLATTAGNLRREAVQRVLEERARAAGIELVADNSPVAQLFGVRLPARDYQLMMFGWQNVGEPLNQNAIYGCDGVSNFKAYCSDRVTRLLAEADETIDPRKRAALVNRADRVLADDVPTIPLFQLPTFLAHRTALNGVADNPSAEGPLWNIEEWWLG